MKKVSILTVLAVFLLCGCNSAVEPNDLAYVVAVGIDDADGADYDFTLQIANPQAISGGSSEEGGEGGRKTVTDITITAPTVFSAVNIANHLYSKQLSLAHTKLIAVSEELARGEGLSEFGELIARSEEIRPNTYLSVTSCAAKEYLAAIKPTNEVNPVQYYQVIFDSDYTGFIPHNPSQDFYAKNMSAACENVLPLSGIKSDGEAGIFTDNFDYMTKNYLAGEVDADGDEQTQTYGMAVFSGGRMIAAAGAVECELYNILTGGYSHSAVTYLDRNSPDEPVSVDQSQRRKPKIKVDLTGDVPKIMVKVFLEGDLRTVAEDYIIEENQADFEKQAGDALRSALLKLLEKTARTYRSDIVGFGNYAKRSFPDYDAFAAYDWQNRYPESKFEVEAEFILRRSGLINRRSSAEGGRGV